MKNRKRIWGWFFFDWASQPYATLLLTFVFAPYVTEILGDGTSAQIAWGYGVGAAGLVIAILAPLLGAVGDRTGGRIRWVAAFSVLYVIGSAGLWFANPDNFSLPLILCSFALGLIGMEMATIFTNALLPDLGSKEELGRISGAGWAFGYLGGLIALVLMLFFFAESASGTTFLGNAPAFGLDPELHEGTRFVGPFTAFWYVIFMIPFFLWVRDDHRVTDGQSVRRALGEAFPALWASLRRLPAQKSLMAYLGSSMFYRDGLNGMYVFGGLYAAGMLGWDIIDTGTFGILAVVTAAVFAWIGGLADSRFGPKPVIAVCLVILTLLACGIIGVSREALFGMPLAPDSALPDIAFYALGAALGAAGGALQTASRTMMTRQAHPDHMTEGFGLYALAGKATAFLAPLSIGVVTDMTGSQQWGITPLIALFLIGLLLLRFVKAEGEHS